MMTITLISGTGAAKTLEVEAALTPELRETARVDANRWIKQLRLVPYGDRTMRERFVYRGDSLWWFTELYLHKMQRIDRAVATVLSLDGILAVEAPVSLIVNGADPVVTETAAAFGAARGIRVEIGAARSPGSTRVDHQSRSIALAARLSRLRGSRVTAPRHPVDVAAFVHTAFWRAGEDDDSHPEREGYIGDVLSAVGARVGQGLAIVGVGPRRNFRTRRWWDPIVGARDGTSSITPIERLAPASSIREALAFWRRRHDVAQAIVAGAGIRAAARYRDCDLWPVLSRELREVALVQWPWSVRAMDEAGAALDTLAPRVIVTYAEAGGWGRALMLEARRRQIPSAGVQHGFIYRHWLNYLHEPDEMQPAAGDERGFPRPDVTLLFDRYAQAHLERAGHFPPAALSVTGNARLDTLARDLAAMRPEARESVRRDAGAAADHPLGILAAKFTEIRDLLPAFARAVALCPDIRVAIKPHPAETPDVYASCVSGVVNLTVLASDTSLARALAAADGIITLNSTVAIDAMALGLPALVIGLPNNLSPFVDAGVMLGAGHDQPSIGRGLRELLYDERIRRALYSRASAFLDEFGMRPREGSAALAADEIVALAMRP